MKCLITENNKIVDVVYRVKPSPPLSSLPPYVSVAALIGL